MSEPLRVAAQSFVWTLFARCQHDNEGHDLVGIERYLVRRWSRARDAGAEPEPCPLCDGHGRVRWQDRGWVPAPAPEPRPPPLMTPETPDELDRLLAGASAAPWQWLDSGNEPGEYDELQDGGGEMIASGFRDDINLDDPGTPGDITDGRLCAALRNAAPELIAAARALREGAPK